MRIHEAVCVDAHGKMFRIFAQIFEETFFIRVFRKDGVILICAANHMIRATGKIDSF
jgi:hypothetical protein